MNEELIASIASQLLIERIRSATALLVAFINTVHPPEVASLTVSAVSEAAKFLREQYLGSAVEK